MTPLHWHAVHLEGDRNRARPLPDMEPERVPALSAWRRIIRQLADKL